MSVALSDNFDDNSQDVSKWTLGSIAFQNSGVGVSETNQQLEITPIANEATAAIYGYQSVSTFDFTGLEAVVRLTASFGAPSEGWLVVVLDASNYLRMHAVGGGNLFTRSRVATVNSNVDHGTFTFATHTYWKIRHDSGPDQVVWEYSSDGSSWTELRRIARPITITAVTFYVSGGSAASSATPPVVKFDDFIAQTPVVPPTPGDPSFQVRVNRPAMFLPGIAR